MKPPHSALPLLALGLGLGRVSAMTIPEKIAAANGAPSQAERMKVLDDTDVSTNFVRHVFSLEDLTNHIVRLRLPQSPVRSSDRCRRRTSLRKCWELPWPGQEWNGYE
jgi:hypothetical protein